MKKVMIIAFVVAGLFVVNDGNAGITTTQESCSDGTNDSIRGLPAGGAANDVSRVRALTAANSDSSGIRVSRTYYGSSSSNNGNTNTTKIYIDNLQDIIVDNVKIILRIIWSDIDDPSFVPRPDTPSVSFNGVYVGNMTKLNTHSENDVIVVNPSLVKFGDYNSVKIGIWMSDSALSGNLRWASVVVEGEKKSVKLLASSNLDDKIKLSWMPSAGMSGTTYFVYRRGEGETAYKLMTIDGTKKNYYYDNTCIPGVNYYYYVDTGFGVKSDTTVGKRIAKTVDPSIHFALVGTDYPTTIGLMGEEDVLVAGHAFKCAVEAVGATQNVSIKKIELIGRNIGGAASKKDHKIVWTSDNKSSFLSYATGWVTAITWPGGNSGNNSVDIMAVLKSGPGYHGVYSWRISECEYEMSGKLFKVKGDEQFIKNVYFERDGIDNAERTEEGSFSRIVPNWFAYWRDDGACPGLRNSIVTYRGKFDSSGRTKYGGAANSSVRFDFQRKVWLDRDVVEMWNPIVVNNPYFSSAEKNFFTWDGARRVYGIYKVEDTIAHELQHHATAKRYNSQIQAGKIDSDKSTGYCAIDTGMYALCNEYSGGKRELCDNIVDEDERDGYFIRGLDPSNPDTYGLGADKGWSYGAYGDNELVSMVAGRNGMRNANPNKDWAYPGELSGDIPRQALPSYRGSRVLMSASNRSLQSVPQKENLNTNLTIAINSISAQQQMGVDCVTGIVYRIGVSIQGVDTVEFDGCLIDSHSNIVANAIAVGTAEAETIELLFDAKDIFDRTEGGPYTLGRVNLIVDDNSSSNNVIAVLHDFAIDPIEVNRLMCHNGQIVDSDILELSKTGIVVRVSSKINIANDYMITAELVNTNEELVASATVSNLCAIGTNTFDLTFSSDSIRQSGVDGICSVKNVKLWQNNKLVDADAVSIFLPITYDCSYFEPTNTCVIVDSISGRFIEPETTIDGKLASVRFSFDVVNGADTLLCYDVASVLVNTNMEIVTSVRTSAVFTNGVNHLEISIPASAIAKSGINGPYMFESIELLPQDDGSCGATFRPTMISSPYAASDFGSIAIEPFGTPRLIGVFDYDKMKTEYSYEALRTGCVISEIVLADKNGDFAARVTSTNNVSIIGLQTNVITISCRDITGADAGAPYSIAYLSIRADVDGELPIFLNTEDLTGIHWKTARCFVDANSGSDLNDGRSWDSAYKSISYAINFANPNNTIAVKSGIYQSFSTGNRDITIIALDGAKTSVIDGGMSNRCAYLGSSSSQTNTVLIGFTLRNGLASIGGGAYGGTLKNCIVECNRATTRGGGVCYSVLEDCQLLNNEARYGGGAYMSNLRRCFVSENEAKGSYGGGVCESKAYDCVIQGNSATTYGGGALYSQLYNCTIIGNRAVRSGGGVYDGTVVNSIVWGNSAAISNNHYMAQGVFNCTTPCMAGDGNIDSDPLLRGMEFGGFLLSADSPCRNAGLGDGEEAECEYYGMTNTLVAVVSSLDFLGNERVQGSHVDMGAVEGVTNACLVMTRTIGHGSLDVSFELLEPHSSLTITADESIRPVDHFETNDGRVFVGSQLQLENITSDKFLTAYFKYYDFYVDAKNGDGENDGFSWNAAKKTIQSAIDSAVGGEKIMVAKGVYDPIVALDKAIKIEAVDGLEQTFIDGGGTNRCATLLNTSAGSYAMQTNTVLIGFTIRNGSATSGGGTYGGTMIDCCYSNNVASGANYCYGGGSYYGVQRNCSYFGNSAVGLMTGYGGGASYGTSYECVYEQNSVSGPTNSYGGAVHNGTHYDCEIYDNVSAGYGGGISNGTFYRTLVDGNDAVNGGGVYDAYFYDGEIRSNSAVLGGGVCGGTVYRTVIFKNEAMRDGGGIADSSANDCAITNNVSVNGGGAYNSTLQRCIVCYNRAENGGGLYNTTAYNSLLDANNASGSGGGAYYDTDTQSIWNCTIVGNTAEVGAGVCRGNVYNSVVWANYIHTGELGDYDSPYEMQYSCASPLMSGSGNICADPMFKNPANGDYRLLEGSPCVNVGSSVYVNGLLDLAANVRIQDEIVDMGCYEGAFEAVEETQGTPEPVPHAWLEEYSDILSFHGGDYEAMAAATSPGKNGFGKTWPDGSPCYVWQDFIAGTSPTNDTVFTATIRMEGNTPVVTWEPDTPELRATRVYKTLGKKTLMDKDWVDVTDKDQSEYHFFTVTVDLP